MDKNDVNLLIAPWLSVEKTQGETQRLSFPDLFSAMERGEAASFPALRPHQAGPWHVFLVQLAAHCLELSGEMQNLPAPCPEKPWTLLGQHSPDQWRAMLRLLTPGFPDDEPWRLVVEDLSKPAFMQPPVPEKSLAGFNGSVHYPDDLDLLVTSKNFDVKSSSVSRPSCEDWVLALISLQTNAGYMGSGNYGVGRQNGNYGTRPIMTLQTSSSPGGQWARDCRVILENLDEIRGDLYDRDGKRLLWLEPWDGTSSLRLSRLHPLFIEVCRRVRAQLTPEGVEVEVRKTTSRCARIEAKERKYMLNDPWIPIRINGSELEVFRYDLTYKNLSRVFGKDGFEMPLLLRFHSGVDSMEDAKARCIALMKVKGKTKGYVERIIPVENVSDEDEDGDDGAWGGKTLRQVAQAMITMTEDSEQRVLEPSLARFFSCRKNDDSGPMDKNAEDKKKKKEKSTEEKNWLPSVMEAMDDEVDELFFSHLWTVCDRLENGKVTKEALQPWRDCMVKLVKKYFEIGIDSLPCSTAQQIKARALAELTLFSKIRGHLGGSAEVNRKEES